MSSPLTRDEISDFLLRGMWRRAVDAGALDRGMKAARARLVSRVRAGILEAGDAEISGTVADKTGGAFEPAVILWREGSGLAFEGECGCGMGTHCEHAAALLEYLAKGGEKRIAAAFGEKPHAGVMTGGKTLRVEDPPGEAAESAPDSAAESGPCFRIRVERRPAGERSAWLPEVFARAAAVYEGHRVSLAPSGVLPPVVTAERKIPRDRAKEMEALNCLYALDLLPGAEEPPYSLRKLDRPPVEGVLWAPDNKKWPHPEFYWQRFRHEGAAALERRGWEVRFAPDVGMKPLVFRAEGWRAEIVEEGRGWFHLSAGFEIDGESFELQPILASLVENRFLEITEGMPGGQEFMIFLPDGRGLALPVGRFRRILQTLGDLMEFKFTGGPVRLSKLDAAMLQAEEEVFDAEAPAELRELGLRFADFERIERAPLPSGLKADLREYQLDGYYWMQFLARYGLNGILADDMGLGKTLQTLTHLLAEKESGRDRGRPSLVVAPTSVVENWQREAEKFAPSLKVLILQGTHRKRRFRRAPHSDLVLTSYALLHRDLEDLRQLEFHLLALDEAQYIKNPGAQVTRAVAQLNAEHRLCLSGTPVENNLGELWSLMNFLMPGLLGSAEAFRETFRAPIEKNGDAEKSESLSRRLSPLILRRTKNDVAKELPPKTEILHSIEMNEAQKDLYETVRSTMDRQVRKALAIRGNQSQIVFLDALLKLRQICCHPQLVPNQAPDAESAKFDYFIELLDTLRAERHRMLVFSQFTSMLSLIEAHLASLGCPYLKLTGETKNRQELVERFQGGDGEVFLISLKAGGTGLTLTGADNVIHYDPWWNPAAENQATDRAYRIGQDKPVFVHKLICRGTVEEKIQRMQEKKGDLANGLLSGATQQLSLTPEMLGELLGG